MNEENLRFKSALIHRICTSDELVIYGAGTMGKAVRKCLTEEPYNLSISCFIVKSMEDNADIVDGLQVVDIEHASMYKNSCVLIALNGKFIPEVITDLTEAGFRNLVSISFDGDEWTAIRGNWIKANDILPPEIVYLPEMAENKGGVLESGEQVDGLLSDRLHIYVVHSVFDRKLTEDTAEQSYETGIQVGAALTDKKLYDIRDNNGEDNISVKNKQYCELTGIYWVSKNDRTEYIGFSHYRRKFVLTDDQIGILLSGNIDVVVTEPLVNFVTVKGQYAKDHIAEDWDTFMGVLGDVSPEYMEAARTVQGGIYYYAYNMFIMKREIFDQYCDFIFPILKRCEELIGVKEDNYQNRYVGFLAERLLSIFLTKNNMYKVAIADKHFVE